MAKRDKRETRLAVLKNFYELSSSGYLGATPEENLEKITKNVQFAKESNGIMIFESEFDNFAEKYPSIDLPSFRAFCEATGAIKVATAKEKSGESHTRLNTEAAALERGVKPEEIPAYIAEVELIYATCKSLNSKMTGARASFAIPRKLETPKEEQPAEPVAEIPQ